MFFAIICVANILVAFATVFRNSEAEFFHTLPIKPVEIFTVKFLDSFLYSSALMLILVVSAVAGYASYFKNLLAIVVGIPLVILPMILSAACIGAVTLLVILKLLENCLHKSDCCGRHYFVRRQHLSLYSP